jgi:hypothetical protein
VKTDKERIIALETTISELKAAKPANKARTGPKGPNKKWAWKLEPPKMGLPHTIQKATEKGMETYHWCPKHQKWCIHTPAECKLTAPKNAPVANETVEAKQQDSTPPVVKIDTVPESIAQLENIRYFA